MNQVKQGLTLFSFKIIGWAGIGEGLSNLAI